MRVPRREHGTGRQTRRRHTSNAARLPTRSDLRTKTQRQGGRAMAKGPSDFAQQNTERAVQATNYGMNWMREIAEQNLTQSKAALEGWLMITRKAVDGMDEQASAIRERSEKPDRANADRSSVGGPGKTRCAR